ncbi:GGDEF domain-containing protein [Oceanobacillus profundus]|uniref:GGDEF domain-containing protein n=1 Tax=Oceanobacillus profundus TaxID=372463 RepID=UPI0036374D84|nr:GGDEF domain-containing protein [Oceanobacillus sp.]
MHVVIGDIARETIPVLPTTNCENVYAIFNEQPSTEGIVVAVEMQPVGLIMRDTFFQKLSTKYGFDLFMQRPIELMMDTTMLVVDYITPLTKVSTLAMKREQERLYDYVIVQKQNELCGVVSIRELIMKLSEVQINIAKYSNPLSGLPGNHIIDDMLEKVLHYESYTVLYLDLDHFKAFNDVYGFKSGDQLLVETANIIQQTIGKKPNYFVGHIGGDDFIAVIPNYQHEDICKRIIARFEQTIISFYSKEDIEQGYVKTFNRKGTMENVPLVSISIAVVQNKHTSFSTPNALSREAAEIKRICKACEGSIYLSKGDKEAGKLNA